MVTENRLLSIQRVYVLEMEMNFGTSLMII